MTASSRLRELAGLALQYLQGEQLADQAIHDLINDLEAELKPAPQPTAPLRTWVVDLIGVTTFECRVSARYEDEARRLGMAQAEEAHPDVSWEIQQCDEDDDG